MLSKEEKLKITKQIVESDTFKNAPTSIAILRYLVKANIENQFLKEGIIDIEFFGAKPDNVKSNPRVRVNIYNLRKKLKTYYEREGSNDLWHLYIDKGQYSVRFEKQSLTQKQISFSKQKHLIPYLLLLAVVVVLIISHFPAEKPKIWKGFFENKHVTNLFIGDAFGYEGETISGLHGWTRDFEINSVDDYYAMLENNPELKTKTVGSDITYATRMAENATHDLARFFNEWKKDFTIQYATRTSFNDIKKGNTIYVGKYLNQKDFIYLFNEANPNFKIEGKNILFSGHVKIPDTTFQIDLNNTELDYTIVSRVPGPNNTEQFYFFSNHDIGVMATVENFTNADFLDTFTNKYLEEDDSFTAIYEVKGKERINLDVKTIMVVPFN